MSPYERHRHLFADLLDPAKWPLEWLDDEIASGQATAFGNERACIVATLRRYPGGAVEVHGLCAAGELTEIVGLVAVAEQWGREYGAILATIASRRGWVKALPDYAETQVMIEKDLSDGA